jgi:hypothetical protein
LNECFFALPQKLSAELDLKEAQLSELARHCEGLQVYPDIQQLAAALSQHLQPVQEAIHDAAKELKIRHDMLQVLGNIYQLLVMLLPIFFKSLSQLLDSLAMHLFSSSHPCCLHEQFQISVF